MAHYKRIKSRRKKGKLDPIPHNNRSNALGGRLVRQQIIEFFDPDYPDRTKKNIDHPKLWFDGTAWRPTKIKRTLFHVNTTPFEEHRTHIIKKAIAENDLTVRAKLSNRERLVFDKLIELKERKEKNDSEKNDGRDSQS